jgi:hypothetical protein
MPNRTAKFVLAVFASFLAGAPVSYAAAAPAADECLSGPKGQTPPSGHWYYRIDHATKRHCWHLADERDAASQTAAAKPSTAATPLPPETETPMQKSVANARAELPVPSAVGAPAAPPAEMVRSQDNDGASTQAASQQSVFASRWPNLYSAEPLTNLPSSKRDPDNGQTAASQTPPPSVIATEQFAAADMSAETPSYSLQMQLGALAGMLTLAGIMGTVIFRYNNSRQLQPGRIRTSHDPIWQSTDDDRIVLSPQRGARGFARDADRFADRSDGAAEFFARISRRASS